jgi:hypothetical protein
MTKTFTKGNVVVEDIKIGDIHYEYGYGQEIKTTVITLPSKEEREDDNYWTWKSKTDEGKVINYGVSDKYSHYGPNLYTYPAYRDMKTWTPEEWEKFKERN